MKQINRYLKMSRRDNILVKNRRFSTYHRPVKDGMWEKENNHFYCLNQDSQDLRMSRMRKIEIENKKTGSVTAIYTLSLWYCCRDAMLRVFFGDKKKATSTIRHCRLDLQSSFIRFVGFARFIRREASRLYNLGDSDFCQNDRYRYTKAMSRMGLNMYNPLQAKCSWGYKMTSTLSELRSSSICYHDNHSNQINHSSDKRR